MHEQQPLLPIVLHSETRTEVIRTPCEAAEPLRRSRHVGNPLRPTCKAARDLILVVGFAETV